MNQLSFKWFVIETESDVIPLFCEIDETFSILIARLFCFTLVKDESSFGGYARSIMRASYCTG